MKLKLWENQLLWDGGLGETPGKRGRLPSRSPKKELLLPAGGD
jgi:hypothetical protein